MILHWLRNIPFKTPILMAGIGLAVWFLAGQPADALNNRQQLLIGGGNWGGVSPVFSAPGMPIVGNDFPSAGVGETGVQARLTGGGVLSKLFVRLRTQNVQPYGHGEDQWRRHRNDVPSVRIRTVRIYRIDGDGRQRRPIGAPHHE